MRIMESAPIRSKYLWKEWSDGKWREAEGTVDFQCTAMAFAQACRKWCRENGYRAEVKVTRGAYLDGTVQFAIMHRGTTPAEYEEARQRAIDSLATANQLRAESDDPEEIAEALAEARSAVSDFTARKREEDPAIVRLRPLPPEAA